jgi:hypothetical protein
MFYDKNRIDQDGPTGKFIRQSATEQQKNKLEYLFDNIDKEIVIPERPEKIPFSTPADFVRHVPASQQGASSADLGRYMVGKKKEAARQKVMEIEAKVVT